MGFAILPGYFQAITEARSGIGTDVANPSRKTEAVKDVMRQFVNAWNRDDADTLVTLFLPNGQFTSPTGSTATNRAEIKRVLTKEHEDIFRGTTLAKTIHEIRFPAENAAEVTGVYELEGVSKMLGLITVSPEGTFRFHLKRQGGRWLIQQALITRS